LTPNLVGEDGASLYNSIDASLWLVYAAYKYHLYTGDDEFIREIYSELLDVVSCCRRGNVCVGAAADGLLESVAEGSSFTWMDARVDGLPVTPRVGKCVEVNALYYNALRSLDFLGRRIGEDPGLVEEAECVKKTFNEAFWYQEGRYLYDCLAEDSGDKSLRPNQILAISLPFPVLEEERWGAVYKAVERELLTPYGLRTLSPRDPRYHGRCQGSPGERDHSYHNGTAWAWLIGPFITAHVRLGFSGEAVMVRHVLNHFKQHLSDAGLGSVSEIFDGDPPYRPRGCIAQAWSVGELLRVIHEDLKGTELKDI
jgi:predicted glycogen debranching enzyme